jgi:hypothetical protein
MPHAHSVEPAKHNVLKGRDVLAPELHRDWEEDAGGCKIDVNWGYEHSLSPAAVAFELRHIHTISLLLLLL